MKTSQKITSIAAEISSLLYTTSLHLSHQKDTDQLHFFANQLSLLDDQASQEARDIALLVEDYEALPGEQQQQEAFSLFSSINRRIERLNMIAGEYQGQGN